MAIVVKASWPDQRIIRGTLETIADIVAKEGVLRQAMIVVSHVLDSEYELSKLYDKGLLTCTAVLRTSMMKELETVAPLTGSKKNRTAILSVSERGAKLGQRIKSLVAPHADCFEKENRPSGGEAIYFDSLKNHIGQIFKDYDQVLLYYVTRYCSAHDCTIY